jgi:hypothetical protein
MAGRFTKCDLPGLPKRVGKKDQDLRNWYCGHVRHIREFVALHPSHALIELDLYDMERSATVMAKLFQVKETCWGHSNKGTQTRKETRKETRREVRSQKLSMQTEQAGKLLGTQK